MIISGFPGIGKTELAKKYENVIDLDGMPYIYELTLEQEKISYEKLKGTFKEKSNNWPENYIEEILKRQKQYDIVLICQHQELLEKLNERNIDYITVFPNITCKEEYSKRYKDRGNSEQYIEKKVKSFDSQIKYLLKKSKKYWILNKGEYLENRLLSEGFKLKK